MLLILYSPPRLSSPITMYPTTISTSYVASMTMRYCTPHPPPHSIRPSRPQHPSRPLSHNRSTLPRASQQTGEPANKGALASLQTTPAQYALRRLQFPGSLRGRAYQGGVHANEAGLRVKKKRRARSDFAATCRRPGRCRASRTLTSAGGL